MGLDWMEGAGVGLTQTLSRWGTALTSRLSSPPPARSDTEPPKTPPETWSRAEGCGVLVVSTRRADEWSDFLALTPEALLARTATTGTLDEGVILDLTCDAPRFAEALGPLGEMLEHAVVVALVSDPEGAAEAMRLGARGTVRCVPDRIGGARTAASMCRAMAGRPASYDALQQTHDDLQAVHARLLADSVDASARHAMIVHDLRSPLSVVRGVASELLEGPLSPDDHKLVELMAHASLQLETLVARLEQLYACGSDSQRLERIDMTALARGVVDGLRHSPETRGKTIEVHAPRACFVRGDRQDLVRVLSNLLGNALRHARERVEVHVSAEAREVCLAVLDDGPGIPAAVRAQLFHRVVRNPGAGRMGLGLAIVHRAVDRHGGRVSALDRSERDGPGQNGACFVVRLPLNDTQS